MEAKMDEMVSYGLDLDIYYKRLNKETIDLLHSKGIKVNCWTVDNKEEAEALVDMGIDFITTNILE
jgi:glycerophosphoryl diester phosphodiesterase